MTGDVSVKKLTAAPTEVSEPKVPFGVNEIRLNSAQWLITAAVISLVVIAIPLLWEQIERFSTGPDYRIPYQLSKDYWLYARRQRQVATPGKVILLGDSVVWGEYVLPDGTLSHFLNREAQTKDRFINSGLNGLFPLAQEGLVADYSRALRNQKLLVQFNLLWLTSPKADLSTRQEEQFNHAHLVPQFFPRIPCYKADLNERLSAVIERKINFLEWVDHLQNAYFGQKSIIRWILTEDGGEPPRFPNAGRNPLAQITLRVPSAPADDPERGPKSKRHKPWSENNQGTAQFEWVDLQSSFQWHAFQRVIQALKSRGNDVMVLLGPFNEHIMSEENRAVYRKLHNDIAAALKQNHILLIAPDALPSALYADASHPLTQGYELMAKQLFQDKSFQKWLE